MRDCERDWICFRLERDSVDWAAEKEGDERSREAREAEGEKGPGGTALSSREKMERSSPFQLSPQ